MLMMNALSFGLDSTGCVKIRVLFPWMEKKVFNLSCQERVGFGKTDSITVLNRHLNSSSVSSLDKLIYGVRTRLDGF